MLKLKSLLRMIGLVVVFSFTFSIIFPVAANNALNEEVNFKLIIEQYEFDTGLIADAINQYQTEDYSRLSEPVPYRVLWIGYTQVLYGSLDFRMTDFDREYLRAVALNFEKSVERMSGYNADITVDLFFIDSARTLSEDETEGWLYLAQETVQSDIDIFNIENVYDTVLTTVQTGGEENYLRNYDKEGFEEHYVMLGLNTASLTDKIGYSTFDLARPHEGTYPLQDPSIPSLYATAVAVHEWLHQLEPLGQLLGIEYPNTHAYMGEAEFPGYRAYIADQNNYDFFEFYELVLQGKLPYYGNNERVKHVGLYPAMWRLITQDGKRNFIVDLGLFTISDYNDHFFLTGSPNDPHLTISERKSTWDIQYEVKNDRYILLPTDLPGWRIDLNVDWDEEGNTVGVWPATGYEMAQTWNLTKNSDGTYSIRTVHSSGRAITVSAPGADAVISTANEPDETQKWHFRFSEEGKSRTGNHGSLGNNQEISWFLDDRNHLYLTGPINDYEFVYIASYDEDGKLLSAVPCNLPGNEIILLNYSYIKLFWLNHNCAPKCQSVTIR